MRVICDTNIIIDFAKIHNLDLLKNIFNEVLIPAKKTIFYTGSDRVFKEK